MADSTGLGLQSFKIEFGGTMPGEQALVAIFAYSAKVRERMSQANADRYDALQIQMAEDTYAVWRRIWEATGVLPPPVPK